MAFYPDRVILCPQRWHEYSVSVNLERKEAADFIIDH